MQRMDQLILEGLRHTGTTQRALADATGVRPQAVNKWVKGENNPPPERWPLIETLLELEAGSLAKAAGWESRTYADGTTVAVRIDDELTARVAANVERQQTIRALRDPAVVAQRLEQQDERLERIEALLQQLVAAQPSDVKRGILNVAADGPPPDDPTALLAEAASKVQRQRPRRG